MSGGAGDIARNHREQKLENVGLKEHERETEVELKKMRADYDK